jgi:O-antigen ligase
VTVYPLFGCGLGGFESALYHSVRVLHAHVIDYAHNDYLQLLVEMGALGFVTMLWFLVVVYRNALKKLTNWTTDINGAVGLAALLGCTGILVHSFVDFNLQIPANAALFYVLCILAAMEPRFGLSRRVHRRHETPEASA